MSCWISGPYYGSTKRVFRDGSIRSTLANATLLRKSSINTYMHTVREVMKTGDGYSVMLSSLPGGSEVIEVRPGNNETFRDAYLTASLYLLGW